MPAKQLLFRSDARAKLLRGATALADAVRITLGPRSKSVLIAKKWGPPIVCNDGVTIAKELELEDLDEDLGVRTIRQAAERTGDAVGDGTSTATLLAHAIYAEGVRNVEAGASAIDLKRGLDRGLRAAVAAIRRISRPVTGKREKEQIATISAHNDETIGQAGRRRRRARRRRRRGLARGRQGHRDRARGRGGHVVRPRLPLAVLRHRRRAHGVRAREAADPDLRRQDRRRCSRSSRCSSTSRRAAARS